MSATKLYDKSGKLKGTVFPGAEDKPVFVPITGRESYYAQDKEDFLAKLEGGYVWDDATKGFNYPSFGTARTEQLPPTFFHVVPPPADLEGLLNARVILLDGHCLIADERRDGRTKVAQAHIVLVDSKGVIGGYLLDTHYVLMSAGRYKAEYAHDLVRDKEYIFYSPEQVLPKHKGHMPTGQLVTCQSLAEAIGPEENRSASGPSITKPAAIQCLWEAFGGGTLGKLTAGVKGVYLNTAVTSPLQIAFLVASGYKLFRRTSATNRRKDCFAVKGP